MKKSNFKRIENLFDLDLLESKTFMIIGLGGVGSYAAESVARMGVGNIIIIDSDKIEDSNINRQLIALESTIGQYKTDVLEARILDINKDCNIVKITAFVDENNITEILEKYKPDYTIDCIDSINSKVYLIKELLAQGLKFISATGTANKLHPEMFEIQNLEKTTYDPICKILRKKLKDQHVDTRKVMVVYSKEVPFESDVLNTVSYTASVCGLLLSSYCFNNLLKE